jgi:hypothetical protein
MRTTLLTPATLSLKRPTAPLATSNLSVDNWPAKAESEVSKVASVVPSKFLSSAMMPVIFVIGAGRICFATAATAGCAEST